MDSWLIDESRKLHVCGNNPDCPGTHLEQGSFRIKGYEGPVLSCDKCGAEMRLRTGRFGKYFACTACPNTRKLLRNGEAAPPKMPKVDCPELPCVKAPHDHYVIRDGAAGLFLAAASYPKVRETRNPLVKELLPHIEELPEKYRHLGKAPVADPDGNPAIVRFARKSKDHYVTSEVDGKPSKWALFWDGKKWAPGRDGE
jgi:DNA topoisomerase I